MNQGEPPRTETGRTVREFLERTARRTPTPGGGAAAPLAAALAAALGEMAARFTLGGEGAAERDPALREILARLETRRAALTDMVERDVEAYGAYVRAAGLPRSTPQERDRRAEAMRAALRGATEVPLGVARECTGLLTDLGGLASLANPALASDVGVAAALACAALEGSRLNVLVNSRDGGGGRAKGPAARELEGMVGHGNRRAGSILGAILRDLLARGG